MADLLVTAPGDNARTLPLADGRFARPAVEADLKLAAAGLRDRGIEVEVVDTAAAARESVLGTLPHDGTIFTAVSDTLLTTGIAAEVDDSGRFDSIRAKLAGLDPLSPEARRLGAAPDLVIGSVQALTVDGRLVVVSATGSQLGAYAAGASRVIWVIGAQKVVPDMDTAWRRVDEHCLPLESERCLRVYGKPSRIYKRMVIERDFPGRSRVVLVRQAIGF